LLFCELYSPKPLALARRSDQLVHCRSSNFSTSRGASSIRRWPPCSAPTKIKLSGWRRYLVWESIPRTRSLPKWAPRPRPFLQQELSPPGSEPARAKRRPRELTQSPLPEGQPPGLLNFSKAGPTPRKTPRDHLHDSLFPLHPAHGTQSNDGGDRSSTLSPDLEDPAPRVTLRGARSRG
jgi:hypothetical protein